ncbi:tRNA preQ1(34) S-adenosylmethionine ribosyltransferase-isomerase QueA [Campylobacter fetus]|uniref:S-adenosylmethionine:tRNA ribosyltransferase-isomerase n=3 Tax=Campylobacter fetus TaxID=196 RepID=QUEA_CAMFF|nr:MULTISPECIES: tRNA preQ1(34) S-adenosylmethionine ribosyltransferase-isomerase QueA [Campylobacter]A0RPZ6.1 RecName: Full=S-adenosylmethionine:tRNA ribosyltransferase-isomerase; AltName: Full=Queuosine biosynthesis protein QueA [Campylobacter fetus subsp. fetus 82-40]OCS21925.1 S-adenosylmethionine:tRNA ribosyltransferase-isomerase [Campylobacter fetus subsp. venerealis cfvi97/532]OCS26226.1 S-adenosylmethionine:tRNA ribosyltransferase-isomerase [Campylobacter fetus subsp. venerealis cfvB10]
MSDIFSLSSYDYKLPQDLIATAPTMPKEEARLLVYDRQKDSVFHLKFKNLSEILPECAIIFNDTKVIKARIYGRKDSGAEIQMLLNQPLQNSLFSCYIRGKVKVGTKLKFDLGVEAEVLELKDDSSRIVKFKKNEQILNTSEIYNILSHIGHVPLPPYIKREDTPDDEIWYQSIFAKNEGAVAAPTASLHFNDQMLDDLNKTHDISYITLHVGAGTFKGVEHCDIREHKMHSEFYCISKKAKNIIDSDIKLLGVGTTVTRCIEYYYRTKQPKGFCDLFLHPDNKPLRQDFLLTNFHLPKSTLIMLVASFIGLEKTMEIYKQAVENRYKFYSYGDGMLII